VAAQIDAQNTVPRREMPPLRGVVSAVREESMQEDDGRIAVTDVIERDVR
jgi:hypothetical protein